MNVPELSAATSFPPWFAATTSNAKLGTALAQF
jgi:hypothetical protein